MIYNLIQYHKKYNNIEPDHKLHQPAASFLGNVKLGTVGFVYFCEPLQENSAKSAQGKNINSYIWSLSFIICYRYLYFDEIVSDRRLSWGCLHVPVRLYITPLPPATSPHHTPHTPLIPALQYLIHLVLY